VRDPTNESKVNHLKALEGAKEKLELFKADLLEEGSFDECLKGCEGVIHTATPVIIGSKDGENDVYKPGMKGLKNVLTSVEKTDTIKKFVLTSSMAAMAP